MTFLGPAKVGDRITLKAQVNRAFGSTLEVGVRVEGQTLGGPSRHINTGYFTLMGRVVAPGLGGTPTIFTMPKALAESKEDIVHHEEAMARRHLRMEKKTLASVNASATKGENLSWKWNDDIAQEICVANVYGLLKVANASEVVWRRRSLDGLAWGGGTFNKYNLGLEVSEDTWGMGITSVRVTGLAPCAPKKIFDVVMDSKLRGRWDSLVDKCEAVARVDDNTDVEWRVYKDAKGASSAPGSVEKTLAKKDFSLLRTWRLDGERYIVALRSIVHPACPVTDTYERGSVNPSGFILSPFDYDDGMDREDVRKMTAFSYVIQMDKVSSKMVNTEGGGFVEVLAGSIFRLCSMLEQ